MNDRRLTPAKCGQRLYMVINVWTAGPHVSVSNNKTPLHVIELAEQYKLKKWTFLKMRG